MNIEQFKLGDKIKVVSITNQSYYNTYGYNPYGSRYKIGDIIEITNLNGMAPGMFPSAANNYSGIDSTTGIDYPYIYHGDIEPATPDKEQLQKDLEYFEKRVKETKESIERIENYPEPEDEIAQLFEEANTSGVADIRREKYKKAIKLILRLR
jgi:hypothetical protein